MISLQQLVRRAGVPRAFPATATKLAAAVWSEKGSVKDAVAAIEYDQAVTADVLKWANSASSGSTRKIATIREAVIRLGGVRILEHLIARHVRGTMNRALPVYGYAGQDLWRHSVAAGVAAGELARHVPGSSDGLLFTAALLHDIGKLFLGTGAPAAEMENVWRLVNADTGAQTCEQAEREVLGFSHVDVGAEVVSAWRLPEEIVEAIRRHHDAGGEGDRVTDGVKAANFMARAVGAGIGHEGMGLAMDGAVAQRLRLSRDTLEKLCAATAVKFNEVLQSYGSGV